MATLVHNIVDKYHHLMDEQSDPRVKSWSMMSSPFPTLIICLSYSYFSKVIGPKLMENRKPFQLRKVLIVYNLFQTLFSTWIFYEYMASGWGTTYSYRCQPVDYSNSPMAMRMARTCWWYYFSKFTEFFDTFFFILRKKYNQVSTLHVIHHGIMPMSVWMGMKFAPGGHSTFFALLNTFVHIIMYFYYMVAAMGPQYQKYIWWKKYLTTFQMVQFVAIFIHQFQLLFVDCNYPKSFMVWIALHGVLFLFLFSKFYKQSYKDGQNGAGASGKSHLNGVSRPVESTDSPISNGVTKRKVDSNGTNGTADYSNKGVTDSYNGTADYSNKGVTDSYNNVYYSSTSNGFISESTKSK